MSLFKKVLSGIGIGSAQVDTIIQTEELVPGEEVEIVVKITGGKTEQKIDGLYISLCCNYEGIREYEEEDVMRHTTLEHIQVAEEFTIQPEEKSEIPVLLQLPYFTPLTFGNTRVWLHTGLDIPRGKDSGDQDSLEVVPGLFVDALFQALNALGFDLVEAECYGVPTYSFNEVPFLQEFEFQPVEGPFYQRLDEIEVICFPEEDHLEVKMEIDRKARGLSGRLAEILDQDESHIHFEFGKEELPDLPDRLYELIEDYC